MSLKREGGRTPGMVKIISFKSSLEYINLWSQKIAIPKKNLQPFYQAYNSNIMNSKIYVKVSHLYPNFILYVFLNK